MATWDDVRRIALSLPEATEGTSHGQTQWQVQSKGFVWERPLRRKDIESLGKDAPNGPVLGAHVEHVGIKDAPDAAPVQTPSLTSTTSSANKPCAAR